MKKSRLLVLAALIAVLVLSAGCALGATDIGNATATLSSGYISYTEDIPTLALTLGEKLTEDIDYTKTLQVKVNSIWEGAQVSENGCYDAGSYRFHCEGTGNYDGEKNKEFTIQQNQLGGTIGENSKLDPNNAVYTGKALDVTKYFKVIYNKDSKTAIDLTAQGILSERDGKELLVPGEYHILLTGDDKNFISSSSFNGLFTITKLDLANAVIDTDKTIFVYNGNTQRPTVTVYTDSTKEAPIPSSDYTLGIEGGGNPVQPGKYTLVVKELETSSGSKYVQGSNNTIEFKINYQVNNIEAPASCTGGTITPKIETLPETAKTFCSYVNSTETQDWLAFDGCDVSAPESGNVKSITIPEGWVGVIRYDAVVVKNSEQLGSYAAQNGNQKKTLTVYSELDPETISVECSETSATVTWTNPDSAAKYILYLDDEKVATLTENAGKGKTASYTFTQLEAGSTHSFKIVPFYTLAVTREAHSFTPYSGSFTTLSTGTGTTEKIPVESFKVGISGKKNLNGKTLTLEAGKQKKLIVSAVRPRNATNLKLRYRSSNTAVCTVKNGMLVAKKAGTATITVTARSNSAAKVVFKVKVK